MADLVLRVWPEFGSSGIWAPPDPAAKRMGGMVDYALLDLTVSLMARFQSWQARYDEWNPPEEMPAEWWDEIQRENRALAMELHLYLGCPVQWLEGGHIHTISRL